MRDDICTIPISEAFEEDGCPFCIMERKITKRIEEYILGPAMMEPDIREMTNKSGFCHEHFQDLLKLKNRLSLSLIIQSYLTCGAGAQPPEKTPSGDDTCFICENLEHGFSAMIKNFFARYAKDDGMREAFEQSGYLCRVHYKRLMQDCKKGLPLKARKDFCASAQKLYSKSLAAVTQNITEFADSFDYRNSKNPPSTSDAIERAIDFITGR